MLSHLNKDVWGSENAPICVNSSTKHVFCPVMASFGMLYWNIGHQLLEHWKRYWAQNCGSQCASQQQQQLDLRWRPGTGHAQWCPYCSQPPQRTRPGQRQGSSQTPAAAGWAEEAGFSSRGGSSRANEVRLISGSRLAPSLLCCTWNIFCCCFFWAVGSRYVS